MKPFTVEHLNFTR